MNINKVVEVTPCRKRSIKGSFDVKKIVYKELWDKVRLIQDWSNLTSEEIELVERARKVDKMDIKVKTFLPANYLQEIKTLESRAATILDSYCLNGSNYMNKDKVKNFISDIKPLTMQMEAIIDKIVKNWGMVEDTAADLIFTIADGAITEEEARVIAKKKIPKMGTFTKSYANCFCYRQQPLVKSLSLLNIADDSSMNGNDFHLGEIRGAFIFQLEEALVALDDILYQQSLEFMEKKQTRPKRKINACLKQLNKFKGIIETKEYFYILQKLEELSEEDNPYSLTENMEITSTYLIQYLKAEGNFNVSLKWMSSERIEEYKGDMPNEEELNKIFDLFVPETEVHSATSLAYADEVQLSLF